MKTRWTQEAAHEAIRRWGARFDEAFALRLYTARLIGEDPTLVLHGGGNVSLKTKYRTLLGDEIEALYVKASGRDLATLEPDDLAGVDLAHIKRLRSVKMLTDQQMVNELRTHLLLADAPTPSIETLLHAFLPHRYIDHTHADAVLTLTNQPDGEAVVRDALGGRVAVVSYVRPGFELAEAVAECYGADPGVDGIVLLHHGLITFGDDARTAYERHIALVDACERFIENRAAGFSLRGEPHGLKPADQKAGGRPRGLKPAAQGIRDGPHGQKPADRLQVEPSELAARVAPLLRGLLAVPTGDEDRPYVRSILEWRADDDILAFVNGADAGELARTGPLTGDHLIHTKPTPMFVEDPHWSDDDQLRQQLRGAVETYRHDYKAYMTAHGGSADTIDPSPRVVLLPGAGMFCWGHTKHGARVAADIAEHTLAVKAKADAIGRYTPLSLDHLYDMEHRALQRMKLHPAGGPAGSSAPHSESASYSGEVPRGESFPHRPLDGQVVVISGGAGAIGAAVARVCAEHGAHVAVADLDEERLSKTVRRIEQKCGAGTAFGLVMDVTDEKSVRSGFDRIALNYGGVDVVVPNAGIAHVAAIENMDATDFRRVMEVNAVGYMLFMREGIRVLKRQGLGGHVIVNASKNVFGPGKDFGAYSASKAAGHQLGKVAAIELAPYGIRVNMINADAIFGDAETPSGLWAAVGPQRAESRDLKEEELPDYYRSRNLLKARVLGHHVGNAVVFFASNATPTTGATLPVDGGLADAFPR